MLINLDFEWNAWLREAGAGGSNPLTPTNFSLNTQLVTEASFTRVVQEMERVLSSRFAIVEIEQTSKSFSAMNWIIG